ncbi:MAG: DUF456 family protein [Anaerolineales bacterium]|nr:DUF456 family protein [Anaerolineales bacterium]
MSTVLITIGIGFLILIGLVGIVLPVLPDILLIWGAAMGYGWLMGWGEHAFLYLAVISVLGLAALGAEVWMSGIGARIGGASLAATLGGLLLGIIGLVFLGPAGAAGGLLLGSFLIEYYRHRDAQAAIKGMLGIGVGYGSSLVVKLILGGGMALTWLVWVITG